jgi:hypothetical protein
MPMIRDTRADGAYTVSVYEITTQTELEYAERQRRLGNWLPARGDGYEMGCTIRLVRDTMNEFLAAVGNDGKPLYDGNHITPLPLPG